MSDTRSGYATVSVQRTKDGILATDTESLTFHETEEQAREEMKTMLTEGDKLVALLVVEGLYRTKSVEIEKT